MPTHQASLFLCALSVSMIACATASTTPGGTENDEAACWPVVPLELQALEHGREWEPLSNLLGDGTITNGRGPIGRIANDQMALGKDGGPVLLEGKCAGRDVEMTTPLSPAFHARATYTPRGELTEVSGFGATIFVADDGLVEARMGHGGKAWFGRPGSGGGVIRVVGNVKRARRTAALLVYAAVGIGAGR
jgi:hypothetical protein